MIAINVALEKHRKIDRLSQPMSQREGFAHIEVRALGLCAPWSLYMIPRKETPVGRVMRRSRPWIMQAP